MKIKNILLATITGIGIGMPVTILCMSLIGGWNEVVKEFLVWLVASALYGVISLLFKSTSLPLPLTTAIHCAGCLGITCGACAINYSSENFTAFLLAVVPIFVVVYAVIYISALMSNKKEAKSINEKLENKQ